MRITLAVVAGIAALLIPGTAMAAPPGNDDFANATVIDSTSLPYTDSAPIDEATSEAGEPGSCAAWSPAQSVWYTVTPSSTQLIKVSIGSSYYYAFATAYEQTGAGLGGLYARACAYWGSGARNFTFLAEAGKTYYIQAGSNFSSSGSNSITVELVPAPVNDNFADATSISALPFSNSVDATGATNEQGEPTNPCAGYQQTGSAWYRYTPTESGSVSVTANYYNSFVAYSGTSLSNLSSLGCRSFGGMLTFRAEAGTSYYFQLSGVYGTTSVQLQLVQTPPPVVGMGYYPSDPSSFDTIQFYDQSSDPGQLGFSSWAWDFGDGGTATNAGCCPTHRYLADGDYTVRLTVTTLDGRTGSGTRTVQVRTHDVAVAKLTVPQSASVGQSRSIVVGLSNRHYAETVRIDLFRSTPSGFVQFASSTQSVPVKAGGKTTDFSFNYIFTNDDAAIGKVTFKAVASIVNARDALLADNEVVSLPTKVK
jgi:hypothetical protein